MISITTVPLISVALEPLLPYYTLLQFSELPLNITSRSPIFASHFKLKFMLLCRNEINSLNNLRNSAVVYYVHGHYDVVISKGAQRGSCF